MAVEKNYARLGLFIFVAVIVVLATAVLFIQRLRSREVMRMVTYTNENVSGLEISSPVRYRGVPVGQVTDLRVDPRENLVEIDFEVFTHRLNAIGMNTNRVRTITDVRGVFPKLRARMIGNPVTQERYLLLDSPQDAPPPIALGFTPQQTYVPSMPSPLANVQDRLPIVLERAETTLQGLREVIARVPKSLDRSDQFFTNVGNIIQKSDLPALSADSRKFFATTTVQMEQMRADLNEVMGNQGSLAKFSEEARTALKAADLPAAAQAAREAADNSRLAADDLRRSIPAIRDSLEQMRELARLLEEQPESVVYGPRTNKGKH